MRSHRKAVVRVLGTVAVVVLGGAFLTACPSDPQEDKADKTEQATRDGSYKSQVANQPAHAMEYSPTRDTINAWIDTWGVPGQLSFTYITNNAGEKVGYYVLIGPPVSYCAALTPNWKWADPGGDDANPWITVPAPSVDGAFYSGGQCIQYYGRDASTGAIIEFTVGGAANYISFTQPLDVNVPPLGPTSIGEVQPNADGEYIKTG